MAKQIKKHGKKALILGLILMLVAMYLAIPIGQAASLTEESDLLSDSRPSTASNHTVKFKTPTGVDASTDTITLTFATGFDLATNVVAFGDMDLEIDAACDGTYETSKTLAATPGVSPTWGAAVAGQVITFTAPTDAAAGEIAADSCVQIEIGTNATGGANQIINPTAGVKDIDIAGTFGDTGKAKVAIIAGVGVTATVAETLSFTIAAVSAASCNDNIGGTDRSDEGTHDADTVPFGTITPETFYFSCQSFEIKTNAENGYTATVQETDQLKYGTTEFPDGNCDGACSETAVETWTTTTNDGFGYCMDDVTGNAALTTDASDDAGTGATDWVTANQCDDATPTFKIFPEKAVDSPDVENVMKSFSAVADTSYVGYRINAAYTQAAGAYSNTTIYVATPTY